MNKIHFKNLISLFLIFSLCLLTACGGGGGGNSSNGGSGGSSNTSYVQAACIASVITNLSNNINNIFPSSSNRLNIKTANRLSLQEIANGEELMKLSGITQIENEGGFIDKFNDSIEKFYNRNKSNILNSSNSLVIADKGNNHIGLMITTLGTAKIKTYFATEENSSEIIGVSYIKISDYTTFVFKTDRTFTNLEGRLFKYDQNKFTYNEATVKDFSLAEIYGDDTSFNYFDIINNTNEIFDYNGKSISGGKGKTSDNISYLEKYPETIAIRLAVKPLIDNADKIINYGQSSSDRANIEISDNLKQINTLSKVRVIIPADTIDNFSSYYKNSELLIDKEQFTDNVITAGLKSMIISKHTQSGLNVGLLVEAANVNINSVKYTATTRVWFIADPNGKAIVCFAYCDTKNSKSSTTFIFKINAENKNVEGISFWNEAIKANGLFENFGYDENDYQINCRNSTFISNNPEQITYTLYNSVNRFNIDGSVTIKYDGTLISMKSESL